MNKSTESLWDSAGEGAYARMNQAWQWLCDQRENAPEGADSWDIRWQALNTGPGWLTDLTQRVLRGEYRLAPLQLQGKNENRKAVWGAQDALVLKWTALSLQHLLPLHSACEHVKGHGGGKVSIMKLHHLLTQPESGSPITCRDDNHHDDVEKKTAGSAVKPDDAGYRTDNSADNGSTDTRRYKWVCRTDIRGYYRNIDKQTLLSQVRQHVQSPVLTGLVNQYIHYTVEDGGTFHTPEKGISRGCPLSPLMGALHLYDMDEHFAKQKAIHYARYMDDIIILAKSRGALRRHTKRLMQWFSEYGFEAHPDKTYIGRTEKGFDWMGAWLTHEGVTDIAPRAKANHREKVRRLYERLARVPLWRRKRARQQVNARVSTYRKRWNIWAGALLCVTGAACADSPLVVLASGNLAGDTGARYPISAGPITMTFRAKTKDYGGMCLSMDKYTCRLQGLGVAHKTPLGWGIELLNNAGRNSSVILVPKGTATRTGAGPNEVATMNLATGDVVYGDGTGGRGCAPLQGDNDFEGTWQAWLKTSQCPASTTITGDRGAGTLSASGQMIIYALGPLSPGLLTSKPLYIGHHTDSDYVAIVPKPSAIVISGLNCNIQVTSGTGASSTGAGTPNVTVDYGSVPKRSPAGNADATAALVLTTTCSGTNSSDAAAQVTLATSFSAGAGTVQDASGYLRESGVAGHYLTLNQNTGACNASNAVTGMTTGKTYAPGAPGTVSTETVVASLCSDGTTATLGQHTIRAVAKLVNR